MADIRLIFEPALLALLFMLIAAAVLWLRRHLAGIAPVLGRQLRRGMMTFAAGAFLLAGFQLFNAAFAFVVK